MKKIETYFEQKSKSDSKHILNTCNRQVPQEILDEIEAGCSIETLEKILGHNFSIYKYGTQITIHGLFPDVSTRRIGGSYVNLVQNKNRSIGVRYNAIDREKKTRLFNLLSHADGWRIESNSTSYNIYKMENLPSIPLFGNSDVNVGPVAEKIRETVNKFREQANRIDKSLFLGNVECYLATTMWGSKVIILEVNIQCFYERNFQAIFENISGMTLAEGKAIMQRNIEDAEKERKEREERYEREAAEAAEKKARLKEEFLAANPIPEGFIHNDGVYTPQEGDILMKLHYGYGGYEFQFSTFTRHAGRILVKSCDQNGENVNRHGHQANPNYKGGWIRKAEKKAEKATPNKTSGLKISYFSASQIILTGDTYPLRHQIKEMGGRWNRYQTGWTFPKSKEPALRTAFAI